MERRSIDGNLAHIGRDHYIRTSPLKPNFSVCFSYENNASFTHKDQAWLKREQLGNTICNQIIVPM